MKDDLNMFVMMLFPCAVIGCLFLFLYEDGVPFSMYNKIKCRLGYHKFKTTFGRVRKYYCLACKKPRKHPPLTLVKGSNKIKCNKS